MNSGPQQFGLTPSRNVPGLNFVPSCRISSIPDWKTSHSACTAHLRVLMWPVTVAFFSSWTSFLFFFFASREVLKEARIGDFSLVVLTIEALKRCAKEGWAVKFHSIDFLGSFENTTNWNGDLPGRRLFFSSILLNEHKCFMWAHPVSLILPLGWKSPT